jgi:hypothetical protein
MTPTGPPDLVGHADWTCGNLCFDNGQVSADEQARSDPSATPNNEPAQPPSPESWPTTLAANSACYLPRARRHDPLHAYLDLGW